MSATEPEAPATPTATLAAEIKAETEALNALLGRYASKAEVTRQLEVERETTRTLVDERDHNRLLALGGVLFGVLMAVAVSLWALNVSHDARQAVKVANTTATNAETTAAQANDAAAQAREALTTSKANEEQQKVVSCDDSNDNRSALLGLFDFIDEAVQKAEAAGQSPSPGTKDLIAFGRRQFAQRDCAAEAAARATNKPGG